MQNMNKNKSIVENGNGDVKNVVAKCQPEIKICYPENFSDIFLHYDGELEPQPVHVWLDPHAREMWVETETEIGQSWTEYRGCVKFPLYYDYTDKSDDPRDWTDEEKADALKGVRCTLNNMAEDCAHICDIWGSEEAEYEVLLMQDDMFRYCY